MDNPQKSEAQSVSEICAKLNQPVLNVPRSGVAVFPNGEIKSLENELLENKPKRQRARVALYAVESFIDYIERYKTVKNSIIFGEASELGGSFKSIIDYHGEGAGWGEHTVSLTLKTTPEWARWLGMNNKQLTQEQFAEFIEDNAPDIVNPAAADLLDMVTLLQGTKTVQFKSGKTGATELLYSEQIAESTGRRDDKMQLPNFIIVRLTPFVGCAGADITARLRFRISESGKLTFTFVLDRPFKVLEAAFNAVAAQIETETKIPVMLGSGDVTPPPIFK